MENERDWKTIPLIEFTTLQRGHDLPTNQRQQGTIPILGSFGVTGWHNEYKVCGPGVTIGRSGASFGVVSYSKCNFWPLNTALFVKNFHGNDERFAYYLLRTIDFKRYNSGSAVQSLNRNHIHPMPIEVPPLSEQKAIASILGSLDDKIDLNRRMNETLESMARAIFKSWFVDFDPVRAKMDGRQPAGMDQATADLFPDAFETVDGELVPKGWDYTTVANIGKVICGKTPSTKIEEYYGEQIPFVTIPDMHNNVFVTTTKRRLSLSGAQSQIKKMLPVGAISVSCIATPGLTVITTEESQTNQQINSVVPDDSKATYFWYWTLRGLGDEIRAGGSGGSVLTNMSTGRFSKLQVLAPPVELRLVHDRVIGPTFERILANKRQSTTLANLRDTLLPKLLSGELRVKDAEKAVSSAL